MSVEGEFFSRLNDRLRPPRPDLIEKDYHLHRLLCALSNDDYFRDNLVFKGGTCLIKAYTGYHRFSEDVDFTWKGADELRGVTSSQARKACSREIDRIIGRLTEAAMDLGLDFAGDKSDSNQVIIGGGGRMPRFYLAYRSETLGAPAKIKMEVNFVERTFYPFSDRPLSSLVAGMDDDEMRVLFEAPFKYYTSPLTFGCYDPREIYTDKCRAALTRIAFKMRDIIDIVILARRFGYSIPAFRDVILEKTAFMLNMYKKYEDNMASRALPDANWPAQDESSLMLSEGESRMREDAQKILLELNGIRGELLEKR